MGTFGITDFDSSNALCKDGTIDKNNPSNPCVNNGGVNLFGGTNKIHSPFGGKKPIGYIVPKLNTNQPETFTKVLCNDGSTQMVGSNPLGGRVDVPCRSNGGVSENQSLPETFLQKYKTNLLIAGIIVLSYFAYKKFKK